jgi:hypothetical protein
MTFVAGMERIPGSGRKPGTPNKSTALIKAGLQSAVETLRGGNGEDPIKAAFKIARLIEGATAKRLERFENDFANLPPEEFDCLMQAMVQAAKIHLGLAEFAFAKLSRQDIVGDAAQVTVENTFEFVLRTDSGRPPDWIRRNRGAVLDQPDDDADDGIASP